MTWQQNEMRRTCCRSANAENTANGGADAVNNLIMSAAMSTTLPYYQSALKSQLDNAGTSYAQGVAHGNPADSYWQSLQGSALGGYLR